MKVKIMKITINGETQEFQDSLSIKDLLTTLEVDSAKVAIECNLEIIPKGHYSDIIVQDGDKIEIVHFIGGGMDTNFSKSDADSWNLAGKIYDSRLIVGTGKYKDFEETAEAISASGAEIVTVAVRRVNIVDKNKPLLMDYIDPKKIIYLPNTAGCFNSNEALRTLRLAREIGGWNLVKLEVLGDKKNLLPDMIETLKSTEVLTKEGFEVMVYCNDDPLMAKRLENVGACAIMPLAAPLGSG